MRQQPILVFLGWLLLFYAGESFIQRNGVALWTEGRGLHNNDFRHMYVATCVLRAGGNFYDDQALRSEAARRGVDRLNPYVYPPLLAVMMLPLSFLSFSRASLAWYLTNVSCALLAFVFLSRLLDFGKSPWHMVIVAFLLATSEPLTRTITAGQLNLLLLLLLTLSIVFLEQKREVTAGTLLGLAAALKVFPALLIVMLFWRRRFRAAWAALGCAILLTLGAAAVAGFGVTLDYLGLVKQMGYGSSTWSHLGQSYHIAPANQSPAALITRLLSVDSNSGLYGVASMPALAKLLSMATAVTLLVLSLVLTRSRRGSRDVSGNDDRLVFGLFVLTALLVPSLMWDHYLTIALLPAVLYLGSLDRAEPGSASLLLTALGVFLINVPFNFWNPVFTQGWAVALSSVKLLGVMILFGVLAVRVYKQERKPSVGMSNNRPKSK